MDSKTGKRYQTKHLALIIKRYYFNSRLKRKAFNLSFPYHYSCDRAVVKS